MYPLPALVAPPTSPAVPVAEDVSLADLLDLFAVEESAPARRSLRSSASRLRTRVQASSRRAARWGAVRPGTPVTRSTELVTAVEQ